MSLYIRRLPSPSSRLSNSVSLGTFFCCAFPIAQLSHTPIFPGASLIPSASAAFLVASSPQCPIRLCICCTVVSPAAISVTAFSSAGLNLQQNTAPEPPDVSNIMSNMIVCLPSGDVSHIAF